MRVTNTEKGQRRRQELIDAGAELMRESGPLGVSMRNVANRVGCSLSAMTYHFENADELLEEIGRLNISRWAGRAERIADEAESVAAMHGALANPVDWVLRATLPAGVPLFGHYQQLVAAGSSAPVAKAYHEGRGRLNRALGRLLQVLGVECTAEMIICVVDGSAVSALSEGGDVQETSRRLLGEMMVIHSARIPDGKCSAPIGPCGS